MNIRSLILLTLTLGIAGGVVYHFGSAPREPEASAKKPPPPTPVKVAQVALRDMPVVLELVGRGEAFERVTLKSRVDGQVQAVSFEAGRRVAQGDVLVRLDTADFQARVAQAEAHLARNQALLKKARADVTRYQTLKAQGFVSEEKVAELAALVEAGEAGVRADQAALELARLQLGHAIVRAPFSGVVGDRLVHPGAAVKLNETELVELNRIRPLFVSFAVPEKHLAGVRAALAARRLGLRVQAPGQAGPGDPASLGFMDPALDPASGTLRMKARLPNADEALAPGQFLNVTLTLETLSRIPVVPAEAVQQGPEGPFVYALKDDQATLRKVTLGPVRDGVAAILEGLVAGEMVVTDGHSRLVPGGKVKIKAPEQGKDGKPAGKGPGGHA